MNFHTVYTKLLALHGPQGWWPIVNPATLSSEYHINAPRDENDFFEIAVGAILTQNVSWQNADKAISELKKRGLLYPGSIRRVQKQRLAGFIRPAGYYNQKAAKLKNFTSWYCRYHFEYEALLGRDIAGLREELLDVNGIGPETADSILLYALNKKIFVVDAYTKRIFSRLGICTGRENYRDMQEMFHKGFSGTVGEYNEYHALIVAHGKNFCKKNPHCSMCCLADICRKKI